MRALVVVAVVVAACGRKPELPLSPLLPLAVKAGAFSGAIGRGPDPCPPGSSRTHPDPCPLSDDDRDHLRAKVDDLRGEVVRVFLNAQQQRMDALWSQRATWAAACFQMRSIEVAADLSRELRDPYRSTDLDLRLDETCFQVLTHRPFLTQWDLYIATLRTVCR